MRYEFHHMLLLLILQGDGMQLIDINLGCSERIQTPKYMMDRHNSSGKARLAGEFQSVNRVLVKPVPCTTDKFCTSIITV